MVGRRQGGGSSWRTERVLGFASSPAQKATSQCGGRPEGPIRASESHASGPAAELPEYTEVRHVSTGAARKAISLSPFIALMLMAAPAQASKGLVLFPDPLWLLVLIVSFAALVVPMNALLFKPIFRVLDERKERIDGARRRASQLQSEADEFLRRYRDSVREVREEADRDRRQQLEAARTDSGVETGQARGEAERIVERGKVEMESWLAGARADLRSSVEPLARVAAERVLGREFN
jgi:F-type H+-transporting ATPase subunit b